MCHLLVFKYGSLNNNCGTHLHHQQPKESFYLYFSAPRSFLPLWERECMFLTTTCMFVCVCDQFVWQGRCSGHVYVWHTKWWGAVFIAFYAICPFLTLTMCITWWHTVGWQYVRVCVYAHSQNKATSSTTHANILFYMLCILWERKGLNKEDSERKMQTSADFCTSVKLNELSSLFVSLLLSLFVFTCLHSYFMMNKFMFNI